ncbi:hypothetical protein [Prosthecobacter sp.]|jgi:hypothetical protein|uniref:hypothetical protein n=1 Tax=Prosthecobacter sp. TaxID=1965333 RepID=UPI0037CB7501
MKWSWKSFGLQFASALVLGCAFVFSIRSWIDGRQGEGDLDARVLSMGLGGLLAPVIPALLTGWKGWALKPLLVAGVIVSALYIGKPEAGIMGLLVAVVCYSIARKVRAIAFYYAPAGDVNSDAPAPQPHSVPTGQAPKIR